MGEETPKDRELFEKYAKLRQEKAVLDLRLSQINNELNGTEENPGGLVAELDKFMENQNMKTIKYDDLGSVTRLAPTPRPKLSDGNKEEFYQFVRDQGAEAIIKPYIHPATMKSFVVERLEQGLPLPEYLDIFYQPAVRYTPPKGK